MLKAVSYKYKLINYNNNMNEVIISDSYDLRYLGTTNFCRTYLFDTDVVDGKKIKIPNQNFHLHEYEMRQYINRRRSYRRSLSSFFGYAYSNSWDYFLTLTFNPNLVERFNWSMVYTRLNEWFRYIRTRYFSDIRMLVVSEPHDDGAIHFHCLVGGSGVDLTPYIYNDGIREVLSLWSYGFSDCQFIGEDSNKVVSYISKYMTKNDRFVGVKRYHVFGRKFVKTAKTTYMPKSKSMQDYIDFLISSDRDIFIKRTNSRLVIKTSNFVDYQLFHSSAPSPCLLKGTQQGEEKQITIYDKG